MGKVVGLLVVLALAGAGVAVYNVMQYEVLTPLPLAWTHRLEEVQLIEFGRARRALAAKLGAGQRVMSLAGAPVGTVDGGDEALRAELADLDRRIEALQAALRAQEAGGR